MVWKKVNKNYKLSTINCFSIKPHSGEAQHPKRATCHEFNTPSALQTHTIDLLEFPVQEKPSVS